MFEKYRDGLKLCSRRGMTCLFARAKEATIRFVFFADILGVGLSLRPGKVQRRHGRLTLWKAVLIFFPPFDGGRSEGLRRTHCRDLFFSFSSALPSLSGGCYMLYTRPVRAAVYPPSLCFTLATRRRSHMSNASSIGSGDRKTEKLGRHRWMGAATDAFTLFSFIPQHLLKQDHGRLLPNSGRETLSTCHQQVFRITVRRAFTSDDEIHCTNS